MIWILVYYSHIPCTYFFSWSGRCEQITESRYHKISQSDHKTPMKTAHGHTPIEVTHIHENNIQGQSGMKAMHGYSAMTVIGVWTIISVWIDTNENTNRWQPPMKTIYSQSPMKTSYQQSPSKIHMATPNENNTKEVPMNTTLLPMKATHR